jgi:hypothetical protein
VRVPLITETIALSSPVTEFFARTVHVVRLSAGRMPTAP